MKTTITQEQLDELWNAIEYTRATIGPGCTLESKQDPEWGILLHTSRTLCSRNFLDQAIDLVNQLRKELK